MSTRILACHRIPLSKIMHKDEFRSKYKYIEQQEQNQKIASCCRHPENGEIEAWKSSEKEQVPDIYVLHCTCGRKHQKFCVGIEDKRPVWTADGTLMCVTVYDSIKRKALEESAARLANLTPEQKAKMQRKQVQGDRGAQ